MKLGGFIHGNRKNYFNSCFYYSMSCTYWNRIITGKSAGLGAISGAAESYWGKNKGRSMEGTLVKVTKYLVAAFIIIAAVLNLNF